MRRNLFTTIQVATLATLFASAMSALADSSDVTSKCAKTVHVKSIPALEEYYPQPCWQTKFSTVVEITVDGAGRARSVSIPSPQDLPTDQSECIQGIIRDWLIRASRFSVPSQPCVFELRVTVGTPTARPAA
jgi:hypothetical protein